MTVTNLVSNCERNRCGHVELGWTEFMGGELNRGRRYQQDKVQTAVNVLAYWQRLLLFVERSLSMYESTFDLQFSLYDKSDDENAVSVKDKVSNERH